MAQRLNRPLASVLYKERETIFVFRQGERPMVTKTYNLKSHPRYSGLVNPYGKQNQDNKEEMSI